MINPEGNVRNGSSKKTLEGELGEVALDVPRDCQGDFEPQLVKKHQRRLAGLDERILSLYARGLSTRDIQAELKELCEVEISPTLISEVTDAVLAEIKLWQQRPLDVLYPVVYLDLSVCHTSPIALKETENPYRCDLTLYPLLQPKYHPFCTTGRPATLTVGR